MREFFVVLIVIVCPFWLALDGRHGGWGELFLWCLLILVAYNQGGQHAKKEYQREAEQERERERFAEQKRREFRLPL